MCILSKLKNFIIKSYKVNGVKSVYKIAGSTLLNSLSRKRNLALLIPKPIVRKWNMAAFFFSSQDKGLFLQGKVLYMCCSLFQIESWENWSKYWFSFMLINVFVCIS